MKNPDNVKYTAEHEWVARDGDSAKVGITAYAAEALGDVVFIDLPAVGPTVTAGRSCGELESTKSVGDLYAPVTGEVIEINELAEADPSLVNSDPFGDGWLFAVRVTEEIELLEVNAYEALLGAEVHNASLARVRPGSPHSDRQRTGPPAEHSGARRIGELRTGCGHARPRVLC